MPLRPTLSCYDRAGVQLTQTMSLFGSGGYRISISIEPPVLRVKVKSSSLPTTLPPSKPITTFSTRFCSTRDMSTTPEPSVFQSLFQSALKEYEIQTEVNLVRHPLAAQLDHCNTVESILEVLQGQGRAFREFPRGDNEVVALLKQTVHILHKLSITVVLVESLGLVCLSC